MTTTRRAADILNHDFLDIRHRILDVAAALDRIDRGNAPEAANDDPRLGQIRSAIMTLIDNQPDRAERVQLVFSRPFDPNWRG